MFCGQNITKENYPWTLKFRSTNRNSSEPLPIVALCPRIHHRPRKPERQAAPADNTRGDRRYYLSPFQIRERISVEMTMFSERLHSDAVTLQLCSHENTKLTVYRHES